VWLLLLKICKEIKRGSIWSCTIRKFGCSFLFAFHSCSILHLFRDKYWSKIVVLSYSLNSAPPLGGSSSDYCHPFGVEKHCVTTRRWKYFEDMCNRLHRIPSCDRQTDRRTNILPRHITHYAYASHGNNRRSVFERVVHAASFARTERQFTVGWSLTALSAQKGLSCPAQIKVC